MEWSKHFEEMLKERRILRAWVEDAVQRPDKIESCEDGTVHYVKQIQENDGRWLRVIVDRTRKPERGITVFFDRRLRRNSYENKSR